MAASSLCQEHTQDLSRRMGLGEAGEDPTGWKPKEREEDEKESSLEEASPGTVTWRGQRTRRVEFALQDTNRKRLLPAEGQLIPQSPKSHDQKGQRRD